MKMDGTGECNLFFVYTEFSHKSGESEEFKLSFSELIALIMKKISHIFRNMVINKALKKVVIIKGKANIFLEIFEKNTYSHFCFALKLTIGENINSFLYLGIFILPFLIKYSINRLINLLPAGVIQNFSMVYISVPSIISSSSVLIIPNHLR